MTRLSTLRLTSRTLLLSASALAIASVPAQAADVLFSTTGVTEVAPGQRVMLGTGVLQLRLDNGATLSFVEGAEFTLNADGTLDLHKGSVTVAGAGDAETLVRMPEGVEGRVGGTGNAASFRVRDDGESDGHTLSGSSTITRGRTSRDFAAGQMWESSGRSGIRRIFARESQETPATAVATAPVAEPEAVVADLDTGGPVAAAENGLPVSLGDGLAAAGASSDIVAIGRRLDAANGNPVLETYPAGDLARLVALAANLQGLNGGTPFPAAQADIIRTYLRYLANGGSGAQFLTAYAGFLTQYLDLVRAGGMPSQFGSASLADINAFLAYQQNLGRLGALTAQNRALAETYLAFLRGGGNPDLFASTYTDLVEAYFAFVRGGGNPLEFAGATQEVLDAYIAFLASSGLAQQLSAEDQEILAAYLESGGFAFAATYAEALQAYFGYLQGGGLPSASAALTPAQLRAYLELLDNSGLFAQLLGDQAPFYAAYLAFLQTGGNADAFGQLNANIFAGYATQLNAYFAFLQGGGRPSAFTGDPAVLAAYLDALSDADALEAFLGANAGFFAQYLAFLQGGGDIDAFAGLNFNVFTQYAAALDAYYTFLAQGGLPSEYQALTQEQIAAYVAALQAQGATNAFLAGLAGFYGDYLAFLQGGGNPDLFTGLPTLNLPAFAAALNAYAAFLAGGGLPSDYDGPDLDLLAVYLDAIGRSGELAALLGGNAQLLDAFFAYLDTGANGDLFGGLPLYASYVSALQAYFAFLDNGGLPTDYTALTPQQIQSYLAALSAAGGFGTQLGALSDFYTAYFAYLSTGGALNGFAGLPIYADYVSALNAYYAFLAGGGLPGDYTLLTAQQIQSYLAALNGAGGLAAFGSLNTFFTQYFAFIAGGGDPANFAGLPVYAEYLAALQAYYAYLVAGGLPSGYTVLTQAQIEAYLAALDGAGVLQTQLTGDQLDFVIGYLAYLQGGGDPDQFAGLPGTGGGGGITPPVQLVYTGGFNPAAAKVNFVTTLTLNNGNQLPGSEVGFDATAYTLNSAGGLTAYTRNGGVTRALGTMSVTDISGNADVLIGRWTNGTNTGGNPFTLNANQGFHYVLARPVASGFALPTQGTINYELLAATRPTIVDGSVAPGTVTADMAILLGTPFPKVGFEAQFTMPGQGGGANEVRNYSTAGGVANPSQSNAEITSVSNGNFGFSVAGVNGTGCTTAGCSMSVGGVFAGDSDTVGLTYTAFNDAGSNKALIGAMIFGNGTLTGGPAAPVVRAVNQPANFVGTGALSAISGVFTSPVSGVQGFQHGVLTGTYVLDGANGLTSAATSAGTFSRNTAQSFEVQGNERLLIGRWSNGAYSEFNLGANQGTHYALIAPLSNPLNLPTGTATYNLIGGTSPTSARGLNGLGTFEASLAIAFGASPKVGMEGRIVMPEGSQAGYTYTFGNTGGVANPNLAITVATNGSLSFSIPGSASNGNAGSIAFRGGMADVSASQLGFTYFAQLYANNGSGTFRDALNGAAIFGRSDLYPDAIVAGTPPPPPPPPPPPGPTALGNLPSAYVTTDQIVVNSGTSNYLDLVAKGGDAGLGGYRTDATGQIIGLQQEFSPFRREDLNTASNADNGRTESGLLRWTRWSGGTITPSYQASVPALSANQGYHIIVGAPLTNMPTSGTVNYTLAGGTSPTSVSGTGAPGTLTSGSAAIAFGSNPRIGFDLAFSQNGSTYALFTNGGAANAANSELALNSDGGFRQLGTYGQGVTVNGAACATCRPIWEGFLAGNGGTELALNYEMQRQNGDRIIGAAGFVQGTGGGGNGGGGTGSGFTGTRTGQVFYTYTGGSLALGFGGEATLANGQLTGVSANVIGGASSGTTQIVEAGDVGHMAWARWTNGNVANNNLFGTAPTVLGANGGYHVMSGAASATLPASGKVDYNLIATTSPTDTLGSAPGTLTGDLAIQFGSVAKVGFELQMQVGGRSWGVATTGGSANPSASAVNLTNAGAGPVFSATFNTNVGTVTAGGGACAIGCNVSVSGALYGANGVHAGVAMNVLDAGYGSATGLAIFGAPGAATGSAAPGLTTAVAGQAEWDRWTVEADSISAGNGMGSALAMAAPGLDQLAASGIQFSPEQLSQLQARIAAEAR